MTPILLAKLNERYSAIYVPDNECQPYVIAANFNPDGSGDDWWDSGKYFGDYGNFCRACTNFTLKIGWDRMNEIASKAIDGLIEDDPYEAEVYCVNEIEMTEEEQEWFGISNKEEEELEW